MASHHTQPGPARLGAGIGFALVAFALFSGMDTTIKLLTASYAVTQVAFFNALFAIIPQAFVIARGGLHLLHTKRLWLHGVRGLIAVTGAICTFFAYSQLPLAKAYAILFAMPLIITALSVPLLREPVGWRRWCAVLTGFAGVVIMLRPETGDLDIGTIAALVGATFNSLAIIMLRKLQTTETAEAVAVYANLFGLIGMGSTLPFVFVAPSLPDLLLSVLGGSLAGIAFLLLIRAYRMAPAVVVAPFQYSQMIHGLLIGWLIFDTLPEASTLLGAPIVIGSGLFILWRESRLRRGIASSSPVRAPLWRRWAERAKT